MPHYIAFSIGPVVSTLSESSSTRELWASSYLFSWIVKGVLATLRQETKLTPIATYLDPEDQLGIFLNASQRKVRPGGDRLNGVGLFMDRFFFQLEEGFDADAFIKKAVQERFNELTQDIAGVLYRTKSDEPSSKFIEDILNFLKSYFRMYLVEVELAKGTNPLSELNPMLDALETQPHVPTADAYYLRAYLAQARLANERFATVSALAEDAYGEAMTYGRDTMIHIALREFQTLLHTSISSPASEKDSSLDNYPEMNEEQAAERASQRWIRALKELEDKGQDEIWQEAISLVEHRLPHDYVAIVYADGDNVGSNLGSLPGEKHQAFSDYAEALTKFSAYAARLISDYQGLPVYAGGDDLLFFAPVLNRSQNNRLKEAGVNHIFSLIQKLEKDFRDQTAHLEGARRPTLSFGLSIAHFKFPLNESLEMARNLLFGTAKSGPKNQLAFRLSRHSGSHFGAVLPMQKEVFSEFIKLLDHSLKLDAQQAPALLSSVAHKLRGQPIVMKKTAKQPARLAHYLDNSFDEKPHKSGMGKDFLNTLKILAPLALQLPLASEDDPNGKHLYGLLRTLQFMTSKSD